MTQDHCPACFEASSRAHVGLFLRKQPAGIVPLRHHPARKTLVGLFLARLLTALLFAATLSAAQNAQYITYEGTLGSARIGLTLIVKDPNTIIGGHYFYARYLTDIPITGAYQPGSLALQGTDGGAFTLRFKGNGSEAGKPLDFNNSVGLQGTWSKDGRQLAVDLTSGGISPAPASGRWYENITDQSDAVFEAKAQGFYKAVLAGDRAAAAKYTDFPLRINQNGKSRKIASASELTAQWDRIFTPAYLDLLRKDMPHDMSIIQGQAMLGAGEAYFGPKGATVLNLP
jgi:hypothetical protein